MKFGQLLANSIRAPWKEHYLDYAKLKLLLREDGTADESKSWTEEDESEFCDEVLNTQLNKVASFQESTFQSLEQRTIQVGEKLRDLASNEGDDTAAKYKAIEDELEHITKETNELKKFSTLNYTGFLKIVKKHDRKRGTRYKVRPMLQINLSKRPLNSEQAWTPLVNKLSMMYFIVRQNLEDQAEAKAQAGGERGSSSTAEIAANTENRDKYTAYKFWVHPDNLLEAKTYILRHLPVLIFSEHNPSQSDTPQGDPTITSLYFDNSKFDLYSEKVDKQVDASSLRIRWYGQLMDKPELLLEQKIIHENGSSEEKRFPIKGKFIMPFIKGEYKMEKNVQKLERHGRPEQAVADYQQAVGDIQNLIKEKALEPVLRANYTRTAFQKPLDDRVRISIDTDLVFIREDELDSNRPCRKPDSWHRTDLDNSRMEYPFTHVNSGEISRFPFAVLEIKVNESAGKKTPQWIQDLIASHLVHKAPRFSKFVHGVASLFEDYVNSLPFWLSDVETDIRKDPHTAFEEEEQAKAQKAEDEAIVGSYMGSGSFARRGSYKPAMSSPVAKSYVAARLATESAGKSSRAMADAASSGKGKDKARANGDEGGVGASGESVPNYGTLPSVFPSFSLSRYAQSRRQHQAQLPPGVTKPGVLIKDSGPLQVEPKVWLANERTFLKWQHICILLGALAVSLYTAAGQDTIAEYTAIAYIAIAIFAGGWGYCMHFVRRNMIVARSGKDFDNVIGPLIISVALMAALVLNFFFKVCLCRCTRLDPANIV